MKKYVAICIMAIGLYALQPPSWEMCPEIHSNATSVDYLVETPNGVLIAGTNPVNIGGNVYHSLWRSTDGGNTWSPCSPITAGSMYLVGLELTPSGRVYVIYCISPYLANPVIQIFYSDNDGGTWSELPQPRIPLAVIFRIRSGIPYRIGIKYHNGKLYVWGPKSNTLGSPIFHTELWYYDEASSQWNKWDILIDHGFTIEKGPGPQAGQTYLYLGTSGPTGAANVIRLNQPIGNLQNKNLSKEEK